MVTWFFENNRFADAWIPFDRSNQKKLEYVYRHHEELVNWILRQQQQQEQEEVNMHQSIQEDNIKKQDHHSSILVPLKEHDSNIQSPQHSSNCSNDSNHDRVKNELQSSLTQEGIIKDIDLEEEDASIQQYIKYDHNCLFIHLNDSHFEHEITLYPAMLLGSLPDRDILIVRGDMMDHNNNKDTNI